MARGNGRQNIVHDGEDRQRLIDDLARTVGRSDWQLLNFVVLSNHLHLLLKTPRPNLSRGMQAFLSAYALYAARRRRRSGHVFQGRYRAEMIEDESYYRTVSRYIHLNPSVLDSRNGPNSGRGRVTPVRRSGAALSVGRPRRAARVVARRLGWVRPGRRLSQVRLHG
jgi:REP element-mobilizing transposase RayT